VGNVALDPPQGRLPRRSQHVLKQRTSREPPLHGAGASLDRNGGTRQLVKVLRGRALRRGACWTTAERCRSTGRPYPVWPCADPFSCVLCPVPYPSPKPQPRLEGPGQWNLQRWRAGRRRADIGPPADICWRAAGLAGKVGSEQPGNGFSMPGMS
jgi:hypothetical protein